MLYNPSLLHKPDEYVFDNSNRSVPQAIVDGALDVFSWWLTESSNPLWVRAWLGLLLVSHVLPFAFFPHPFATTNLVCYLVMVGVLVGPKLCARRGMDKDMVSMAHFVIFPPILIVNILSLTTDLVGDEQLTWDNAGDDAYQKARYMAVLYNTVIFGISLLFDINDAYQYHVCGNHDISRSKWTTDQMQKREDGNTSKGGEGNGTMNDSTNQSGP